MTGAACESGFAVDLHPSAARLRGAGDRVVPGRRNPATGTDRATGTVNPAPA
jgi:hypothetical protein